MHPTTLCPQRRWSLGRASHVGTPILRGYMPLTPIQHANHIWVRPRRRFSVALWPAPLPSIASCSRTTTAVVLPHIAGPRSWSSYAAESCSGIGSYSQLSTAYSPSIPCAARASRGPGRHGSHVACSRSPPNWAIHLATRFGWGSTATMRVKWCESCSLGRAPDGYKYRPYFPQMGGLRRHLVDNFQLCIHKQTQTSSTHASSSSSCLPGASS